MARKPKDKPARASRTRKAPAKVTEVKEMEEVSGGMSIDDGIVLATTVALVFAVALVYLANGAYA